MEANVIRIQSGFLKQQNIHELKDKLHELELLVKKLETHSTITKTSSSNISPSSYFGANPSTEVSPLSSQ